MSGVEVERFVFETTVRKVDKIKRLQRAWKDGDEVKTQEVDLGYFAHFNGSWESIYLGHDKPLLQPGDTVRITIEKITHDLFSPTSI